MHESAEAIAAAIERSSSMTGMIAATRTSTDRWACHSYSPDVSNHIRAAGQPRRDLEEPRDPERHLGHASISVTIDRYGHLSPGNESAAAGLLDGYLARAAPASAPSE